MPGGIRGEAEEGDHARGGLEHHSEHSLLAPGSSQQALALGQGQGSGGLISRAFPLPLLVQSLGSGTLAIHHLALGGDEPQAMLNPSAADDASSQAGQRNRCHLEGLLAALRGSEGAQAAGRERQDLALGAAEHVLGLEERREGGLEGLDGRSHEAGSSLSGDGSLVQQLGGSRTLDLIQEATEHWHHLQQLVERRVGSVHLLDLAETTVVVRCLSGSSDLGLSGGRMTSLRRSLSLGLGGSLHGVVGLLGCRRFLVLSLAGLNIVVCSGGREETVALR
mmetsp:Transcript_57376/g.122000  ORF Transcript_57376/g.122000 Transcript_57376/m.122000 type:complete len:279 (+) Transcript_57376:627-1463(+)